MASILNPTMINASRHPAYFSSFLVKDCWNEVGKDIQEALDDTIQRCTQPGTKERKKAVYRHENPAGNLYGLMCGGCNVERVAPFVRLIEFLCIIDDVLEDLPHREALIEHEILCKALRGDEIHQTTKNTRPEWISFLRDIRSELLAIDSIRSPALLNTLNKSLRDRDSSPVEFGTIEEYIPYRLLNFDYEFVAHLFLWTTAIDLTAEETESDVLQAFKYSIGVIVGLANDYYSWNKEKLEYKLEGADRIRNAVAVLLKQYRVSEKQAQAEVKKMVISEESRVHTLLSVHESAMSAGLKRYVDTMQVFAGGYVYWCSTCPRYARPQGLLEPDSDQSDDSDQW
ncbi:fusicoccadiene synthase [Moniliophthora roreri MCA 2997]|uniref:Fusicoccadiene synthase n=1 Tax=Moniliophthora roreri (strain MCA 2997) TaxID=1381753 RepID=V2X8T7_MONRO|nr:fusicoccadiene synthase [Moniliophthora roreri MCA 2997]